jgi:histidinol-phosphate aminotransferase/threonine-phosphate decarboxylase
MDPEAARRVGRVPHGGCTDPSITDFSANVNPRVPDDVTQAYEGALAASRRYPADDYSEYRVAAGEYVGGEPGHVIPTAGGLGGIRLAIGTLVGGNDSVLVPYPSFEEYGREVELQGARVEEVPHDAILAADPSDHAMAIVCHPNNPTGTAYESDALLAFLDRCRAAGTALLADEAFLGFTDRPSLAGMKGTVVVRSLTKLFGLPGLRAGFLVAPDPFADRLDRTRLAWNLSTPAAQVGAHCMRQQGFVEETRERVSAERDRMAAALADRYEVFPSEAPFLLLDVADPGVDRVLSALRAEGMTARDARSFRGLDSHLRVAVRLPEENDRLLGVLLDDV